MGLKQVWNRSETFYVSDQFQTNFRLDYLCQFVCSDHFKTYLRPTSHCSMSAVMSIELVWNRSKLHIQTTCKPIWDPILFAKLLLWWVYSWFETGLSCMFRPLSNQFETQFSLLNDRIWWVYNWVETGLSCISDHFQTNLRPNSHC